ncbi:MAG: hypothetical protein HY675_26920 [Chloroflexi bacterium]|nr:hypothetical protein [Chloroflexota bacterium]
MLGRSSRVRPKVINFNLVPLEFRRPSLGLGIILLIAAVLAGGFLFLRINDVRADARAYVLDLQEQLARTKTLSQRENSRIAADKSEATKLEGEVKRVKDEIARNEARPPINLARQVSLAPLVEVLLASQVDGLRLTSLAWNEPKLVVQGRAASMQHVISYAGKLRASGRFADIGLQLAEQVVDKDKNSGRAGAEPGSAKPATAAAPGELAFVLELSVPLGGARR